MNKDLARLRALLNILHRIEPDPPPAAISYEDHEFLGIDHGPGLFLDAPPRVEHAWLETSVVTPSFTLAVGVLMRGYDHRGTMAENPPPGIFIGTTDALAGEEDLPDLLQPIFPNHGLVFASPVPGFPGHFIAQFCWGPTDNRDRERRGYMDGTPTPLPLRQAFDLPERFPAQTMPPERRVSTEVFIAACQAFIRLTREG